LRCAASAVLLTTGDLAVSLFMVALVVSLLVAHLQLRNEALSRALAALQTLLGLLPISAWCKRIRDHDGDGGQTSGKRPVATRG
jgi:hypothetical protein